MKKLNRNEIVLRLVAHPEITVGQAHVAMSLMLGKSYDQMSTMYGTSLCTALNRLKKLNVVTSSGFKKWNFNEAVHTWKDQAKREESAKAGDSPTTMRSDNEATLEMMAQLEQQLNELKKRVG